MVGKGNYVGGRPKDTSRLSKDPAQIRRRLRRANKKNQARQEEDVKLYLEATGKKPIEEWDWEELAKGRPRDSKGGFTGRKPTWITPTVTKEAKRRLMDHTLSELNLHINVAIECIVGLIKSEDVDDHGKPLVDARTKLAASMFIIEHVTGKPKAVFEIEANDNVRQALAAAIVLDDGKPQGHLPPGKIIEDVEFTEDNEEDVELNG